MCKVIAIVNQKGGVGKTTTALNLGYALSRNERKTLLIDLDPQGSLTISMGYDDNDSIKIIKNLHWRCLQMAEQTKKKLASLNEMFGGLTESETLQTNTTYLVERYRGI